MEWSGKDWRIEIEGEDLRVVHSSEVVVFRGSDASQLILRRRMLGWRLYRENAQLVRLRGIRKSDARAIATALQRLQFIRAIGEADEWRSAAKQLIRERREAQRWISREELDDLIARRPPRHLLGRIHAARCDMLFSSDELESAAYLEIDLPVVAQVTNEEIMTAELITRRAFFDSIEKSPLTEEQSRVVVCMDSRVQVLASAGSGKTSVMVARAAYAVSRGFIAPDRILLLAFNRAAAKELQERVAERFEMAGIDSTGIRASTFHSFGLSTIGRATGKKPRLAPWLEHGYDVATVLEIVDELRDRSKSFRYYWDLYRLLYANAPTELGEGVPDGYDKASRERGYKTYSGATVKSHGERLIADFLYLNGVEFEYEKRYQYSTADEVHSEYRPDFYYPSIDVWHEHWALDRDGRPPAEFKSYAQDMTWKRRLHADYGTTLVESTWADVMFGDGLRKLQADLEGLGLVFDWNPDRKINDLFVKPMKHEDFARLIRTFMAHVKSNSRTAEDLESRLASDQVPLEGFRTRMFLSLYWKIHAEWEKRLAEDGSVDFEDMLVRAAQLLEDGMTEGEYDLVMVDEFQDSSQARARLIRGLLKKPHRFLLTVGDDWQSINRFAGSDLSVMTNFEEWFGRGPQLALTTTFRCSQVVCDVARAFVSKNPSQFDKPMRSVRPDPPGAVTVVLDDSDARGLSSILESLSTRISEGSVVAGPSGRVSVDVLGRYGFQKDIVPQRCPNNLDVTFRTVHGSKGLEADYVVIPGVTAGTYGFPSNIADDPVLRLAMPASDSFAHAEERRLFYVALTRARREVVVIAPLSRVSPFVVELLKDPHVSVIDSMGRTVDICTKCGLGTKVARTDRRGRQFIGCSTFPSCDFTEELAPPIVKSKPIGE